MLSTLSYYFALLCAISLYFVLFVLFRFFCTASAKFGTTEGSPRNTYNGKKQFNDYVGLSGEKKVFQSVLTVCATLAAK